MFGKSFSAQQDSVAYVSLSSDYLAVAVLAGELRSEDGVQGGPGRVLVTPLDGTRTERFQFDVAQLRRTLPGEALDGATALTLDAIERRQRRARYFGLLEPVGVNASAAAPDVEQIRRTYLNEPLLVRLRRSAKGDARALSQSTSQAFVAALASGAHDDVAALIDPGPFLAQTTDPIAWRAARAAFAQRLASQPGLAADLTGAVVTLTADPTQATVTSPLGRTFTLTLTPRDRALFVTAFTETPP
ncbi:MAG: hypothetical protein JNJ63_00445 [Hyphomonadaceae bacterium]|nr:hypothetical protein [Hyphomonadaceae bacterium]